MACLKDQTSPARTRVQSNGEFLSDLVAEEMETSVLSIIFRNPDVWTLTDTGRTGIDELVLRHCISCRAILDLVAIADSACAATFLTGGLLLVAFDMSDSACTLICQCDI